jgi:LSD1 subclass zinc finger protein
MAAFDFSWFQVVCPACNAALQVHLVAGTTEVRCGRCKAVFQAHVRTSDMKERAPVRHRLPRAPIQSSAAQDAYRKFTREETARLRAADATLERDELRSLVRTRWATAPQNPKNGGAAAGMEDGADGEAATGVHDGADGEAAAALQAMRRGGARTPAPAPARAVPPPPPPRVRPQRPPAVAPAAAPQAKRQRKGSKQKLTKDQCGGCGQRVDGSYTHRCACGQLVHASPFVCTGPTTLIREEDDRPESKSGWLFLCSEACRKHVT